MLLQFHLFGILEIAQYNFYKCYEYNVKKVNTVKRNSSAIGSDASARYISVVS